MSCEYALAGSEAVLYGDYFVDDPNVPLSLTVGGVPVAKKDIKITKNALTFVVPEAPEGPVEVSTIYGETKSVFNYKDTRGLITDFDGTTDVVPQGWNIAASYSSEGGISGDYVVLGPADLDEEDGWQEAGIPICNFIDFSDFKNMAFKFELNIPASNPWSSGSMQIVFTSAARCANDSWQNNTYIHTSAKGGLDLCRALYTPWAETGSFDTGGEWITVTIPFSDFKYNADGTEGLVPLQSPEDFASLIVWPWSGGVKGTECTPVFKYDNLRAVPNR